MAPRCKLWFHARTNGAIKEHSPDLLLTAFTDLSLPPRDLFPLPPLLRLGQFPLRLFALPGRDSVARVVMRGGFGKERVVEVGRLLADLRRSLRDRLGGFVVILLR